MVMQLPWSDRNSLSSVDKPTNSRTMEVSSLQSSEDSRTICVGSIYRNVCSPPLFYLSFLDTEADRVNEESTQSN